MEIERNFIGCLSLHFIPFRYFIRVSCVIHSPLLLPHILHIFSILSSYFTNLLRFFALRSVSNAKISRVVVLESRRAKNDAFQSIRTSNPKHTKIWKASTEYKSLITFYTTRYLSHISQSEAENLLAVRLQIFHIPSVSYHTMGEKHAARRSTERTNGQVNICFDHAK